MNIETVREYCLSLPQVTEDFPFDESTLAFRIERKIFAMIDLENTEWFVLKCEPEYAIDLRDKYTEISGAWHMNKKYWITIIAFFYGVSCSVNMSFIYFFAWWLS